MKACEEKKKRIAHKGITLVEIIIGVAIIGILGTMMIGNTDVINGYRARKCKNLLTTAISELKVKTLSKAKTTGQVYMKIYKDGNIVYRKTYENGVADDPVEIGKRIGVRYGNSSAMTDIGSETAGALIICFDRTNGRLVKSNTDTSTSQVQFIECYATDHVYKLELVPDTGKIVNKT